MHLTNNVRLTAGVYGIVVLLKQSKKWSNLKPCPVTTVICNHRYTNCECLVIRYATRIAPPYVCCE